MNQTILPHAFILAQKEILPLMCIFLWFSNLSGIHPGRDSALMTQKLLEHACDGKMFSLTDNTLSEVCLNLALSGHPGWLDRILPKSLRP
jgi:hypothetical protein